MPTIVVLDTSLSMARPATPAASQDPEEGPTFLELAQNGLDRLLRHLELQYKLEHVALLTFSSECRVLCPFTRDVSEIRQRLAETEPEDGSAVIRVVREISTLVTEVWGQSVPVHIVLVTDGGLGLGALAMPSLFTDDGPDLGLRFPFPGRWSVVLLCPKDTTAFPVAKPLYRRFLSATGLGGDILGPESELTRDTVERLFDEIAESQYKNYVGRLHFGDELSAPITLCPPPAKYKEVKDFEIVEAQVSEDMDIKGFLSLADVASPAVVSRHLILPWTGHVQTDEDSRNPSLTVFLHGAMKVESLCALVQLSTDWFGIIFSCPDVKKKSSLMLSLLEPGSEPVPWLGNLRLLGPLSDLNVTNQSAFPVKGMSRPSYSANPVVWTKQANLHSDVQKILRNARKLPDKTKHFYEELNRLKRAALGFGFHELLEALASTFERECTVLPPSSEPDCHLQLSHAAQELRSKHVLELEYVIQPVGTRFSK
eukprot:snap_masked-scaffold336_size202805-processed-gene-1.8 protein:Tk02907 transcript:snap_masked-scaffold336_size202805-processed-gene-1.8-mRNA-1 annotation:"conserved hypothetical protein"